MYRITFVLDALKEGRDPQLAAETWTTMLRAMTRVDSLYLTEHPDTPSIRDAMSDPRHPVRCLEVSGGDWQDIPTMLKTRMGGPEAMACWFAAERGMLAPPIRPKVIKDGRIPIILDLFQGEHDRPLSHETLDVLLHALMFCNVHYLEKHPDFPTVYGSGVRYEEEPPGQEDWQDAPTSVRMGIADCEDLASWLAAEKRVRDNEPARPTYIGKVRPEGGYLYHIQTIRGDGRIEDPSRALGMR